MVRSWTFHEVEQVLEERYGLRGMRISVPESAPRGDHLLAECGRWHVQPAGGGFEGELVQYPRRSLKAAEEVWHMAAYLNAAVLTTRAQPDHDHQLVSTGRDGTPCVLIERSDGTLADGYPGPAAGVALAMTHQALAVYDRPPRRESAWYEANEADVLAEHARAAAAVPGRSEDLIAFRPFLDHWVCSRLKDLRAGVPKGDEQALHGAFVPERLYWGAVSPCGVGEPSPCTGQASWELARLAFPEGPLATDEGWLEKATALLIAYQRRHPAGLTPDALAATLRIATLDLLTRPIAPTVQAWAQRHTALRTILSNLPRAEELLRNALGRGAGG